MQKLNETTIPRDGLVAEYLLDGNANDTAGTNDGTATNVTWTGADRGYVEEVASFNGSSSVITTSGLTGTLFDNDFSISFSFKYELYGNEDYFFAGQLKDIAIKFNPNGLAFTMFDGTEHLCQYNISNFTIGEYYQVVATRSKVSGMKLYVNTIEVSSDTFTGNANSSSGNPTIGNRYTGSNVQAKIGLFRIYNKALSQQEINNLCLEGLRKLGPTTNTTTFPKDGLVASYDYDDITVDTSGNGNNGTATSVSTLKVGQQNVGVYDGSSSYVTIPSNSNWNFGATYSVNVQCYINALPTNGNLQTILYRANTTSTGAQFELVLYNNGGTQTVFVSQATTFNSISYALPVGKWINLTVTYGSNTITFLLDGNIIGTVSQSTQCGTSNQVINIGRNITGIRYFNGKLGLIRAYNRTLSQSEITTLYHEGLTKLSFPQYSLRNLEVGKVLEISKAQSGGTYYDQTGNGNNGAPTSVTDSTVGLNNVMTTTGSNSHVVNNSNCGFTFGGNYTFVFNVKASNNTGNYFYDLVTNSGGTSRVSLYTHWSHGRIMANNGNAEFDSGIAFNGEYIRIGITKNGADYKLYKNGVFCLSFTRGTTGLNTNGFAIGCPYDNQSVSNMAGNFSNHKHYNKTLSETEMQQDFYSNKIV